MKKKYLIGLIIFCLILCAFLVVKIIIPSYKLSHEEKEEDEKIKNAIIKVTLKEDLTTSFLSQVKVSDFIEEINGEITNDFTIDTSKIGSKEISFNYINEEDIKVPYSFKINIIDDIPPVIWLNSTYTIYDTYDGNILEDITCADNIDDNPKCEIIGNYDPHKIGNYKLTFKATDASNNITTKDFTLRVIKKPQNNSSSNNNSPTVHTLFSDVIKNYKKDNTKIGIDVSSWQGDIDFAKVKEAGVEFVILRVGSTHGKKGDYFVDGQFINNIKKANEVGIPVGIYFYSYADSKEKAIKDAMWVIDQIQDYKVDLPIAYDWESWSFYNEFHQSFYSLTQGAKAFLDTIEDAGYKGMLYSSKNYLEKVWYDTGYPVWLAHYTKQTSYQGNYTYWQLCSNGKVSGINGNVDINIMYN